jgi:Na+-transporting NADH:ubiquinone oxidoreductase subunit B
MKKLRSFLDNLEPLFVQGGRLERFHAIYEMVDTLLYSPPDLTRSTPHIRDAIDLKRVMILVVFAVTPAAIIGIWNTGYQANMGLQALGLVGIEGWRGALLPLLGAGYDPSSVYDNFTHGLLYFLPLYIVTSCLPVFATTR